MTDSEHSHSEPFEPSSQQYLLDAEKAVAQATLSSHQFEFDALHKAMECYVEAMKLIQGLSTSSNTEPKRYVWLLLVTHAFHTVRSAELLLVKGYYGQAASLARNVFEDWLVAHDCKSNDHTVSLVLTRDYQQRINFRTIADAIDKQHGLGQGKTYGEYQALSTFSHPRRRGLRIATDPNTNDLRIFPSYDRDLFLGCIHDVSLGAVRMLEFLAYIVGKGHASTLEPHAVAAYKAWEDCKQRILTQKDQEAK